MNDQELLNLAQGVIQAESASVAALARQLTPHFAEAARLLVACEGHVLVAGSGTSSAIAQRLAHLLSCCGTPALFIHPGDSRHGLSGAVTARDVLVAISKGGETTEIKHLAGVARSKGARVVLITEQPDSTLGRMADIVLHVVAASDVDPYGMIATGSSLTNGAFGDALCVAVLHLRGFTEEAFSRHHPGGAVGIKIQAKQGEQA